MRAIWSGSLSFGLVNIPVKLYSATESKNIDLDMLHKEDMGRIRYARICRKDGQEIPYDEIVKGYELDDDEYVVLTNEDFKKANVEKTTAISIVDFTKENQIDSVFYEKPFFLEPQKGSEMSYALLREALKKSGKVAVARFVLRNREHLAVVKPEKDVLVLNQIRFFQELRKADELKIPKMEFKGKEMEMALNLIDQLSEPFNPKDYKDTYINELKRIIDAKAKGKTLKPKGEEPKPTDVNNLLETLKASIKQEKERQKPIGA